MYSSVQVDANDIDSFLNIVDKQINQDDYAMCENDLSEMEIKKALFEMNKNKSPGPDGLTVEFYCKFYDTLKQVLFDVFKCIEQNEILSRSMRMGHINLIYKNKGDKRSLENWRPISLLNVDYKIIARVIANRLKVTLPNIISSSQSCCILGKDIADTIASVRDVIDLAESEIIEGYILKVDQYKAFDRVDHNYMFKVLEKFGFGAKFINWIKIFYTEIFSSVKCNGFLTKYFPIKNSVRQGCPVSALLYSLLAEPLSLSFQKHQHISGIAIPNTNISALIFQHADDTTLTLGNKQSIEMALDVFKDYGKASGAKINKQKSEILCIGAGTLTDNDINKFGVQECYNVTWCSYW